MELVLPIDSTGICCLYLWVGISKINSFTFVSFERGIRLKLLRVWFDECCLCMSDSVSWIWIYVMDFCLKSEGVLIKKTSSLYASPSLWTFIIVQQNLTCIILTDSGIRLLSRRYFPQMKVKKEHRLLLLSLLWVSANKGKSPDALTAITILE